MGTRLNRSAYQRLIDENLAWLATTPRTLEREHTADVLRWSVGALYDDPAPVKMLLFCPACGTQHIDAPDERTPEWTNPPHKSHLCHNEACKHVWRPADVATEGVERLVSLGTNDSPPAKPFREAFDELVGQWAETDRGRLGCLQELLNEVKQSPFDRLAAEIDDYLTDGERWDGWGTVDVLESLQTFAKEVKRG